MSEWLDLMLEEIARKQREAVEAGEEVQRRGDPVGEESSDEQASPAVRQLK